LAAQGAKEVAARALAYALQQPALVGVERTEAEEQLHSWGASPTSLAWNGPPIDELVHRIVAEAGVAYSPLITTLRSVDLTTANAGH
jgi:hypothetical protein